LSSWNIKTVVNVIDITARGTCVDETRTTPRREVYKIRLTILLNRVPGPQFIRIGMKLLWEAGV
jgi:hypothetical protein